MKRTVWNVLIILTLTGLLLMACAGGGEKVRVATDATWPPFESVDEQSKEIIGFDIDLMNEIAKKGDFEVEYINVAFDPLLAGIAQCQYDLAISAITITDERKANMQFSNPYFEAGQIVTVRTDNTEITGPESLSGKTVGAQLGTTGAIEVEKISGATLRTYDDISLAFQDLMNGQIDAIVADKPMALGYVGQNSDKIKTVGDAFTEENYGVAVCKTNAELLEKVNNGLAAVLEEGLIDTLTQKWLTASE